MRDLLNVAIVAGILIGCFGVAQFIRWLTECDSVPMRGDQYHPMTFGACERCGGTYAVQYGVSVWFASTRRDGEVTYSSAHTWCSHCREQVEAEIDGVTERVGV